MGYSRQGPLHCINEDGSANTTLTPEAEAKQLAAALFGAMMANRVDGRWDSLNVKHPDTINKLAEHYDQQIELSRKIIAALKETQNEVGLVKKENK